MSGRSPTRIGPDDLAPKAVRVTPAQALDMLEGQGLDDVTADDLESFRLVMSPASFQVLEQRLAKALADHAICPVEMALPFDSDITDGWEYHDTVCVPGRLRLVADREFSAWGFIGRLRFRRGVMTERGRCWVDGWDEDGRCHSVTLDRIHTVHRTPRMPKRRRRRRSRVAS